MCSGVVGDEEDIFEGRLQQSRREMAHNFGNHEFRMFGKVDLAPDGPNIFVYHFETFGASKTL